MKELSLAAFCEHRTQSEAAQIIGVSPGRVWQMLRERKEVFIVEHEDGRFSSYEIRRRQPKKVA